MPTDNTSPLARLSDRQRKILVYIEDCMRKRGYPPSVREIGEAVGLSSSATVHNHLATLQRLGYLHRDPTKPRALEVRFDAASGVAMERRPTRHVPLVGDVAAGINVLAQENVEELVPLPMDFTGDGDLFMLRVRGDSMVDAGILDGDFVVCRQQPVADNGDIQCNNISMGGYLSPADLYVSGKGWFNTAPNDTLANGPYLWLTIPSSGDAGDWFVITDEFATPYVAVNESGYATFSAGATISSLIVNNTNTINGVEQGKVSVTTTSTAQNNSLRWSSTYTSVRFWIQGRNTTGGRFQTTELVATRNGSTTVVIATPVNVNTGGVAATYSVDINAGNWRLLITPSLATSTTFTVFYTVM